MQLMYEERVSISIPTSVFLANIARIERSEPASIPRRRGTAYRRRLLARRRGA